MDKLAEVLNPFMAFKPRASRPSHISHANLLTVSSVAQVVGMKRPNLKGLKRAPPSLPKPNDIRAYNQGDHLPEDTKERKKNSLDETRLLARLRTSRALQDHFLRAYARRFLKTAGRTPMSRKAVLAAGVQAGRRRQKIA